MTKNNEILKEMLPSYIQKINRELALYKELKLNETSSNDFENLSKVVFLPSKNKFAGLEAVDFKNEIIVMLFASINPDYPAGFSDDMFDFGFYDYSFEEYRKDILPYIGQNIEFAEEYIATIKKEHSKNVLMSEFVDFA